MQLGKRVLYIILVLGITFILGYYVITHLQLAYYNMTIEEFGSGDAKLAEDAFVAASLKNRLTLIDTKNKKITRTKIKSNWIDCSLEENIIVYSNGLNQTGICTYDPETGQIEDDYIILDDGEHRIDPNILKIKEVYYLICTHVTGVENKSNFDEGKSRYTIELYNSTDLVNWSYVGDVYSSTSSLEDTDLFYEKGYLNVVFEKEYLDKGPSTINLVQSLDFGHTWTYPIALIDDGSDNEPASILQVDDEYWLFYSSDKYDQGASYDGAVAFVAKYDLEFNFLDVSEVPLEYRNNVLLYQAYLSDGYITLLYSHDYLGDNDLILENIDR